MIELLGLGKLSNLHVYQWQKFERYPLEQGEARWETFLRPAAGDAAMHYALLEFVQDDDPEQFLRDAATLQAICKRLTRRTFYDRKGFDRWSIRHFITTR